jgi:hypothetical protein
MIHQSFGDEKLRDRCLSAGFVQRGGSLPARTVAEAVETRSLYGFRVLRSRHPETGRADNHEDEMMREYLYPGRLWDMHRRLYAYSDPIVGLLQPGLRVSWLSRISRLLE